MFYNMLYIKCRTSVILDALSVQLYVQHIYFIVEETTVTLCITV